MSMTSAVTTADDLLQMADDGYRYELLKGELLRMPPSGGEHGVTAMNIGGPLHQHVKKNGLGLTFGAETGFLLARDPDTVLAPDVAFVHRDRIPEGKVAKSYWPGPPDLAVEVISPNDTYTEVEEKVREWLEAGTRMVLVANPRNKTLKVYRSIKDVVVLTVADELDISHVVPGFTCKVSEFFI